MLFSNSISNPHAKSALILGHIHSGMGERTLTSKFKKAIEKSRYGVADVLDILEFMGNDYESFARVNYDLADLGHPMIEDLKIPDQLPASDILLILSWSFSLAALFALGIQKTRPTIAKLFAHHPQERILPELYTPATLLITESLLANERAIAYGMDPATLLYIPHCYPIQCEKIEPNRIYVEKLAQSQGKKVGKATQVIGCVARFEYGKNCEYAVEAVRRLFLSGKDVILVLKGDFPEVSNFPDYKPLFLEMLATYKHEPWLLWDRQYTPFPEIIEEYASFDLLLHPSGAEGGSHVVIECLGLNKPVVLLDCTTNPYLFSGVAHFVKTTGEIRLGPLPFYIPDIDHLCTILAEKLLTPNRTLVEHRFHEKQLEARIPLLFEPDRQIIKELYGVDRVTFGI